MGFNELFIWYLIALLPVALLAWYKNRSVLSWICLSLLLSPLLMFIWLLFVNTIEIYTYKGEKNLSNDSYKIYLTKQYYIEKVETIGKYQCFGKIFDSAEDALKYAFNVDRGLPPETDLENFTLIPLVVKTNKQSTENIKEKKENRKSKLIITIAAIIFAVCGIVYAEKEGLIYDEWFTIPLKVNIDTKNNIVINDVYHLLECTGNCIDAKEIIFTNGKKIENIDDENDSMKKLLVNGQEYENIPFEVGGYLSINSIYPNKNGNANIALLTWNYRGSCCEWTEYHIIYAEEDNLIPISLKIDPQDTFEEINFKIKEGKISNLNVLYTRNGKKISTPVVR